MANIAKFIAAFDSECAKCFGDISEGDNAGYLDDEVCCEDCCDEIEAEEQDEINESGWIK